MVRYHTFTLKGATTIPCTWGLSCWIVVCPNYDIFLNLHVWSSDTQFYVQLKQKICVIFMCTNHDATLMVLEFYPKTNLILYAPRTIKSLKKKNRMKIVLLANDVICPSWMCLIRTYVLIIDGRGQRIKVTRWYPAAESTNGVSWRAGFMMLPTVVTLTTAQHVGMYYSIS
jgi:hypothetical protein